jgi:plastocyanin domain-containing protein
MKLMKPTIISLIVAVLVIGGSIFWVSRDTQRALPTPGVEESAGDGKNVTMENGKQIIVITAKGGFSPAQSLAKAGVPTILRFTTKGTFDCSSSVRIPALNVFKSLGTTGSTDIEIANPEVGVLKGTCGMGMYPFSVKFAS